MSRYGHKLYELLELITSMGIFRGRNYAQLKLVPNQNSYLRARMLYDRRKHLIITDYRESDL